jgi:hypothetical protein
VGFEPTTEPLTLIYLTSVAKVGAKDFNISLIINTTMAIMEKETQVRKIVVEVPMEANVRDVKLLVKKIFPLYNYGRNNI